MSDNTLYTKATIEKDGENFVAIASTAVEDRQGEVVSVDGWELKNFKDNPVLLWGHDHSIPAIGRAEKIWIEKSAGKPSLMFKPKFQEVTELGRAVKELVKQGFIKTFSVGFRPLEVDGNTFTKNELLEISTVNVPANPEAMMLSYKALKDAKFSDDTIGHIVDKDIVQMNQRLAMLEDKVQTLVKGLEGLNPHQGRSKDVIESRIALTKVVARASDNMLQKKDKADKDTIDLAKVIKRTNERLNKSLKKEL